MERKHVKVFGTVQGVGFRFYTQRLAFKYNIVGTVQNVSDYVDIYAQGKEDDLNQFLNSVIEGASPASQVTHHEIDDLEIDSSLNDFRTI
ncbi:acylphosphatase [Staphylococcus simiae]|uniref:acylphosphatase n=1 Tax=Staphylococcus simiae CCM 7213 = CCUG 51256 TaxID=911238 RepID=G5JKC6_9STAP|nr:acylphosphatase [Staphylococcus simiae]EHJ07350.1 acylphosphatase [Staphylococcus simiae CCM 7213 = CCUG 51256]PNZ14806.1 acylphosphatase [Staphylococcus simiae]SNV71313.1 acylphosphatase [Staphylococcus simiae]